MSELRDGVEGDKSVKASDDKVSDEELSVAVKRISDKIESLSAKDITEQLKELLLIRLRNELYVAEAIKLGVDVDDIAVVDAVKLMSKSKDGLSQLGTLYRLFSGDSTSVSEANVRVEHADITERIEQLLQSRN